MLADRHAADPTVWGVEPVNEPWQFIPIEWIKRFYWDGYNVVRAKAAHARTTARPTVCTRMKPAPASRARPASTLRAACFGAWAPRRRPSCAGESAAASLPPWQAPAWKYVMHDSFRGYPAAWWDFMKGCPNKVMDAHIYQAWNRCLAAIRSPRSHHVAPLSHIAPQLMLLPLTLCPLCT